MSWGYPSIVGSGPNATILHYRQSSRKMEAGDLLLVDAAGNYQGLTGDITRTYPISGSFTPAQRDIYELVLAAQEAGMKAARVGRRPTTSRRRPTTCFEEGLVKLRPDHRRQRAQQFKPGTRTASSTSSAWTCTTSATTTDRSRPAWRS